MESVAIIGAGIGGLATAIRLQSKGYQVTVFESNDYVGGKLTDFRLGAYRFDAGPSLFTMPNKVEELLNIGGVSEKLDYERLDEVCRYFYEDGTVIKGWSNPAKFANEIEDVLGVNQQVVLKHLKKSAFIFETTNHLFLEKSLHKIKTYLSLETLKSFLKLPFLGVTTTMHKANKKALKHPKLVQLFNRYATYNGSDPYKAPAVLNIIPHLEFDQGAFFPKGGMHSITEKLYAKAQSLGVEFKLSARIDRVEYEGNQVNAVVSKGERFDADKIICNMDVAPFYEKLLHRPEKTKSILKQERSSSALIFYWGIKKSFKDLILHNIFFSANYEAEFDALFNKKSLYDDPTVYINITQKHAQTDAPLGCENWFVMVNAPAIEKQNWEEIIKQAKANVLIKLSKILKEDISKLIEVEEILSPQLIEEKTSSLKGSLYGTSSNSKGAAFFRHPNFSREFNNLFFCGGSVHPGGGIPLALSSAKIISELIDDAD